jgi:hypothetical protein
MLLVLEVTGRQDKLLVLEVTGRQEVLLVIQAVSNIPSHHFAVVCSFPTRRP